MKNNKPKIIVLSGPESVGKTTMSQQLANHFDGIVVTEFARDYVENLSTDYTFQDVENIARRQIEEYRQALECSSDFVFLDTSIIITKIWFQKCFHKVPLWFEKELSHFSVHLVLLLQPDLPWIADEVRENGGKEREELYSLYLKEYKLLSAPISTISGFGEQRVTNAILAIQSSLSSE